MDLTRQRERWAERAFAPFALSQSVSRNEVTSGEQTLWCVVCVLPWHCGRELPKQQPGNSPAASRREISTPTERIKRICFTLVCAVGTFAPSISYDEHYGALDWFTEKTNVHPQHLLFAQLFHKEKSPPRPPRDVTKGTYPS